jgi:hypothetical protein
MRKDARRGRSFASIAISMFPSRYLTIISGIARAEPNNVRNASSPSLIGITNYMLPTAQLSLPYSQELCPMDSWPIPSVTKEEKSSKDTTTTVLKEKKANPTPLRTATGARKIYISTVPSK